MRVVDVSQLVSPTSGGIRTYLRAKAAYAAARGLAHAAVVADGRTSGSGLGYRPTLRPGPILTALDRLSPDVVVLHDALAFPRVVARWAARRGVPVVLFCHSDLALGALVLPRVAAGAARRGLALVQRRAVRAAGTVMVASRASERRIATALRAPAVRTPLGIDLSVFSAARPDPALRRRLAPPGAPLLLHAGRLSGDKRVDLLPPTLAALGGDAVLVVAGAGPSAPALTRAARRLGVDHRLVLLGHVAGRAELATLMASADCFVHPNPAEPYGLCPLEALAAGCRVVAPDAEGCGETLAGRGAVLVRPEHPGALAAGVRRALTLPRPRPNLSDLSWEAAFAREWALYRRLGRHP